LSSLCILLCTASFILTFQGVEHRGFGCLDSPANGETVDFASPFPPPVQDRSGTREMKRRATGRKDQRGEWRGKWTVSPGESAYPVSTRASTCTRLLFTADPLMPRDERSVAIASERGMRNEKRKKEREKETVEKSVAAEKAGRGEARRARSGARFRVARIDRRDRRPSAESTLSHRPSLKVSQRAAINKSRG